MKPYDRGRVQPVGDHAVVMGASVAGLLAARVLMDAFERVTVLDRDRLDPATGVRRGVPQGRHAHTLMVAGRVVMDDLVPGFSDALIASGAVVLDLRSEFHVHAADDFIASGSGGITMHLPSRPLLERLLRGHVSAHRRVRVSSGCQVTDVLADGHGAVRGVDVLHDGERETVAADLVVDATGRGSRTSAWLSQHGHPVPVTETVDVDLVYGTCQVRRPADDRWGLLIMPSPPRARGAAVIPIEGDQWIVTLMGLHGDHPPADLDGLRRFASTLPTPAVRDILDTHQLAMPGVARYRFPSSSWRRYDRLPAHPSGLLCIGDAIASFNPIYGQGMSVAGLEALALHHALAADGAKDMSRNFYARSRRIVREAWQLAALSDFRFPQTRGARPFGTDVLNRYVARLHRRAHADARLGDAFARVAVMEQPSSALFRPGVVWRVLGPRRRAR